MSKQDRDEAERARRVLVDHAGQKLESIKRENLVLEQENNDLQKATETMRV